MYAYTDAVKDLFGEVLESIYAEESLPKRTLVLRDGDAQVSVEILGNSAKKPIEKNDKVAFKGQLEFCAITTFMHKHIMRALFFF